MGVPIVASPTSAEELLVRLIHFPWKTWRDGLAKDLRPAYEDGVTASASEAERASGITFDVDDPFTSHFMTQYVGERIKQLEETTKDDVARIIRNRFDDRGDKDLATLRDDITSAVREKFDAYDEYRATRIARTETAIAFNHGTALTAYQGGFTLEVIDGDDDGACAQVNGQIWTAERALEHPIQHPNCVRDFAPHLED